MERTFVILKPDSVKRRLVGDILSRFERKNLTITHLKMLTIKRETALEHYNHVKSMPFFDDMITYITSGCSVAIILEGERAVSAVRSMIGKTSCFESLPGTIRGDYGYHRFENLVHASDSVDSAEIEIKRFFPELS